VSLRIFSRRRKAKQEKQEKVDAELDQILQTDAPEPGTAPEAGTSDDGGGGDPTG
jgi:hypothetical protein